MRAEMGRVAGARRRLVVAVIALVALGLFVVVVACSSSSSPNTTPGPNTIPGQCVLSDHVWYCGGAYGNMPACPSGYQVGTCDYDGGLCFNCSNEPAGTSCACAPDAGTDGPNYWQCEPTGTGCKCPSEISCN